MELKDFIEICHYASENWRGFFSPEDVEDYARHYYSEYQTGNSEDIKALIKSLKEDYENGNKEVENWITRLERR